MSKQYASSVNDDLETPATSLGISSKKQDDHVEYKNMTPQKQIEAIQSYISAVWPPDKKSKDSSQELDQELDQNQDQAPEQDQNTTEKSDDNQVSRVDKNVINECCDTVLTICERALKKINSADSKNNQKGNFDNNDTKDQDDPNNLNIDNSRLLQPNDAQTINLNDNNKPGVGNAFALLNEEKEMQELVQNLVGHVAKSTPETQEEVCKVFLKPVEEITEVKDLMSGLEAAAEKAFSANNQPNAKQQQQQPAQGAAAVKQTNNKAQPTNKRSTTPSPRRG